MLTNSEIHEDMGQDFPGLPRCQKSEINRLVGLSAPRHCRIAMKALDQIVDSWMLLLYTLLGGDDLQTRVFGCQGQGMISSRRNSLGRLVAGIDGLCS